MEHARHVFRIALVLVVLLVAVLVFRGLLVPKSYGTYGPYRYDNVAQQMNIRKPVHGGAAACGECHDDQFKLRAAGSHKTVSCEVCQGPLGLHLKEDGSVEAPTIDRSYVLCARCHRKIDGRPVK